ncbi:MAG TPA: hypothetical protein VMY43_09160 [Methanothrix sp.]|nr:hypothetical protein [Methanothrix sp.]
MIEPITVTYEVPPPIRERVVPVPESDWSHLESRISSIEEIGIIFNIAFGGFVAIIITAFATAFTLSPGNQNYWPFITVGIAALVCTILCCIFAHRLNKCNNAHKEDILEDLRILKSRYIRDEIEPQ